MRVVREPIIGDGDLPAYTLCVPEDNLRQLITHQGALESTLNQEEERFRIRYQAETGLPEHFFLRAQTYTATMSIPPEVGCLPVQQGLLILQEMIRAREREPILLLSQRGLEGSAYLKLLRSI